MRLASIQVSGFKSFVEPTRVVFPAALTGIVGPNGCGKSNIIDAVRWVLGESARNIRGETLSDIIFDGSTVHQALDQASVEITVENEAGRLGGEYAAYTEIKIRREVRRHAEHQSRYYINGTLVRRKDVSDLFQGTGLGRGNYAIIAQGTVQNLIKARPEEMRKYLEEAAGISLYRERRRETENRIRHAQENLDRSQDILLEHERRLRHLEKQRKQAERYVKLKEDHRIHENEWISLQLQERRLILQQCEVAHAAQNEDHAKKADQLKELEEGIAQKREQYREGQLAVEEAQTRVYQLQAEAGSVQRDIDVRHQRREQAQQEQQRLSGEFGEHQQHIQQTQSDLKTQQEQFERNNVALAEMRTALEAAEKEADEQEAGYQELQRQIEELRDQLMEAREARSIEQARLRQYDDELEHLGDPGEASSEDTDVRATLTEKLEEAREKLEQGKQEIQNNRQRMQEMRDTSERLSQEQTKVREQKLQAQGRLASLEVLQQSGLASDAQAQTQAMQELKLDGQRLADHMEVEAGWEFAVEVVLAERLGAFGVGQLPKTVSEMKISGTTPLMLLERETEAVAAEPQSLARRVTSEWPLASQLNQVLTAETVEEACALRTTLQPHQSVITQNGIWMGRDWMRFPATESPAVGVLERQREMEVLAEEIAKMDTTLGENEAQRQEAEQQLQECEARQTELQQEHDQIFERFAHLQARLHRVESQVSRLEDLQQQGQESREALQRHEQQCGELEAQVTALETQRATADQQRQQKQQALRERSEQCSRLQLEVATAQAQIGNLQQRLQREEETLRRNQERMTELAALDTEDPDEDLQETLKQAQQGMEKAQAQLREARDQEEILRTKLEELDRDRAVVAQDATELREQLHTKDLERQQAQNACTQLTERLQTQQGDWEQILGTLPEDATAEDWEAKVSKLATQLERMPPINAAAITEHEEVTEQRDVLKKRHEDIEQALKKLTDAINQIDRETRERFRHTFEKVNENLKQTFPRIIGEGGEAHLVMTDQNPLNAGIEVHARPPGKRRRTMQALSGGEQAMAAAALMLSLFMLNPAPFCILDEVDAPLSDDNLRRFCEIIVEMSGAVQFILVTHNKITMEHAEQLIGVTMSEPGISRLVSVDVAQAVEMAAQEGS